MPHDQHIARQNIRTQQMITVVAIILFIVKFYAWHMTRSLAIYTDALESVVNIISGFFGLYSLYISAFPRDLNHPYGHGKIEFIAAAVEGSFIIFAGLVIIIKSAITWNVPKDFYQLDYGIALVSCTAFINFFIGYIAVQSGRRNHSLALVASGKHLQTDAYSTVGIIAGLVVLMLTGYYVLDNLIAVLFAVLIIYAGIKILREAIAGIMDEADPVLIEEFVKYLYENRRENWIDLHNLRIIKYGRILHIDAHMTVPWHLNVQEAHIEHEHLAELVQKKYGHRVELFIHFDPSEKDEQFNGIPWNVDNVTNNTRYSRL